MSRCDERERQNNMRAELKLKYIHTWVDHLGRNRYRFRRHGFPGVELPVDGNPNSPEFLAVYFAALKGEKTNAALASVAAKSGSGTVASAVEEFRPARLSTASPTARSPSAGRS